MMDSRRAVEVGFRSPVKAAERGFSLLEVLIALAIVALVATIVGPRLFGQIDRSKVSAARIQMRALASALEAMRVDTGRYPLADEGLRLLVRAPAGADEGWAGPYLDDGVPPDPWGRPYIYEPPADADGRPRLSTLGGDGRAGGTGSAADLSVGGTGAEVVRSWTANDPSRS